MKQPEQLGARAHELKLNTDSISLSTTTLQVMTENCVASDETDAMNNHHPSLSGKDVVNETVKGESLDRSSVTGNHLPLLSQNDDAGEMDKSSLDDYEETRLGEDGEFGLTSLDQGMTHSVHLLQMIEENNKQLSELVRRNKEKRRVINDLSDRLEKLEKENQELQEQNQKLTEENMYLTMSFQKQNGISRAISFPSMHNKSLTRLKSLFMSTFGAENPVPHDNH